MTTALPQASAHAGFTSNASLRPGRHVILLHETERVFFNIGFDAVQGNPSGASHCMSPRTEDVSSSSDVRSCFADHYHIGEGHIALIQRRVLEPGEQKWQ
ncbi:TPA: hypothetical protein UM046_002050 [Stenotrophomonas maltophilia]|nr:hypothetical protein [Stenotrophomonas maltophilia]